MSDDVRIVKFKKKIEKIWVDLDRISLTKDNRTASKDDSVFLATIYDYDKLNDYGKVIMEQVSDFTHNRKYLSSYNDVKYRIDQAEWVITFIHWGVGDHYRKYIFIFWALMILAVDETDKEKNLSLICDFAKMLHIEDYEMMDIVQIVRLVFDKEITGWIRSISITHCFKRLLREYQYKESLYHR